MEKLSLKLNGFDKGEVLTRAQLKKVMGGEEMGSGPGTPGGNNGNPCANGGCSKIRHENSDGTIGTGSCSSSTGGSTCHNYCADGYGGGSGYYGWC